MNFNALLKYQSGTKQVVVISNQFGVVKWVCHEKEYYCVVKAALCFVNR